MILAALASHLAALSRALRGHAGAVAVPVMRPGPVGVLSSRPAARTASDDASC
jgi:hypothetical protein